MNETLLLLPGLLCDEAVWSGQLPHLREERQCMVIDYAYTDSIETMAERVLEQAPERFSVAGHSLGARVALEVVRRAPERVERLALLSTGIDPRPEGEVGEQEKQKRLGLLELARSAGMRSMADVWLQGMVHLQRSDDVELWAAMRDMVERKDADHFAAQIQALLARPDANPLLTKIQCPTLVSCGREDSWSPLARHQLMAASIPDAQLQIIEACGHMSPMERPQEVLKALQAWLKLAV